MPRNLDSSSKRRIKNQKASQLKHAKRILEVAQDQLYAEDQPFKAETLEQR